MSQRGFSLWGPICPLRFSLWDLDNCVCDDKWRTPLIDWHLANANQRYDRYDAEMSKDRPAHIVEWRLITSISEPIFVTGRRERWRGITADWIRRELPILRDERVVWIDSPIILMRPDDCEDKPVDLKERLLGDVWKMGIEHQQIIAAFDDVPSIVRMYRKHAIPAQVLRVHDPRLAYKPEDL